MPIILLLACPISSYDYIAKTGGNIETRPKDREREPIAASILIDENSGLFFDIYRKQVEAANVALQPIYGFMVNIEKEIDNINDHFMSQDLNTLNFINEMDFSVVGGAFLIIERPLEFEAYVINHGAPEILSMGIKDFHDVVRFEDFSLRVTSNDKVYAPQFEIMESVPVGEKVLGRQVYNHLIFNPLEHKIAFLDPDSPQLIRR